MVEPDGLLCAGCSVAVEPGRPAPALVMGSARVPYDLLANVAMECRPNLPCHSFTTFPMPAARALDN